MRSHFRGELLISFGIIAGAFIVFGVALYFLAGDLRFQTQKIGAARTSIGNRSTVVDSLSALKQDAALAANYKQAMDRILVTKDQLLDFQKWLEDLARVHRVALNFSFQGERVLPQDNAAGYYNFSLELSGVSANLLEFIKNMEYQSPRFLISLYGFDLSGNGDNYKISTNGKVFFR